MLTAGQLDGDLETVGVKIIVVLGEQICTFCTLKVLTGDAVFLGLKVVPAYPQEHHTSEHH